MEAVTATGNGSDGVSIQAACAHIVGGTFTGNGGYGLNLGTSALDLTIAPTFGNNTLGDMNPQTPVTCAPAFPITQPVPPTDTNNQPTSPVTAPVVTSSGAASAVKLAANSSSKGTSYASMTLNSYLASARTGSGSAYGFFFGQYAYVDTDAGLLIFAVVPEAQYLAMNGF
jgi:hypothetical protein